MGRCCCLSKSKQWEGRRLEGSAQSFPGAGMRSEDRSPDQGVRWQLWGRGQRAWPVGLCLCVRTCRGRPKGGHLPRGDLEMPIQGWKQNTDCTRSLLEGVASPWREAVQCWGRLAGAWGGVQPLWKWLAKEGSMARQRFVEVPVAGAWGSPGTPGGCVAGSEDRPSGRCQKIKVGGAVSEGLGTCAGSVPLGLGWRVWSCLAGCAQPRGTAAGPCALAEASGPERSRGWKQPQG